MIVSVYSHKIPKKVANYIEDSTLLVTSFGGYILLVFVRLVFLSLWLCCIYPVLTIGRDGLKRS